MALPPLIPLEQFFDNPERAYATISPDGTKIAFLAPEEGRLNVWVRTVGADDDRCVTHDHTRGIQRYYWTRDSRHLLYLQDSGGDENFHVFRADLAAADAPSVDLTPYPGARVEIVSLPLGDPGAAILMLNNRDPELFDVARLEIATGEVRTLAENPGNVGGYVPDLAGRIIAAYSQTPDGDAEILAVGPGGEHRLVAHFANEDGGDPVGVTPDGSALLVSSARDSDLARLVRLDLASGAETVLDADEEADLADGLLVQPLVEGTRDGELLAARYVRDRSVVHPLSDRFVPVLERLRQIAPGDLARISSDDSERRWVVSFTDDRDPGATYLYDHATGESTFLFRAYPTLDPAALAPMRPVRVTSRDGLTLRCYLTLPVGVDPVSLPTVLLVHGGPWARDAWGYDPEAQFLANRGYAVLQVNYRGSTGFGKAFTHAAEHEFAGKMHDDLIDAVEWAVKEGYADPTRVGIYGGSYGGYAALVGVTFTPDVFAASVSYCGPSSLATLIRSFPPYWKTFLAGTFHRYVGDPDDPAAEADMLARSPITRVDQIRTPLLVAQGANDPRVTKVESDQIVEALRARGVDVEYIVKDDEGHGF
ncbi:MAG: S9 family peptidase, partial [Mycobacteriales bacterium]